LGAMQKSTQPLKTGFTALYKNFWPLSMVGAYSLLLFAPHTIGNIHARLIISQFVVFILPGLLAYKLAFTKHGHDIYQRLVLSFLLSCFVFIVTGSIAYFFRVPLVLYMKFLLSCFIICTFILLKRGPRVESGAFYISKKSIFDFAVLLTTGIVVYFFSGTHASLVRADAIDHLANIIKIADSGIITPITPLLKEAGLTANYLYSPYYLILAVIKRLSAANQYVVWHHLPKVIIFFLPVCYYTLVYVAFKDRCIAYFAFAFVLGLYLADYYWYSIAYPYPRRFNREILTPVFYIFLIRYFRNYKKKGLILLVISSIVLVMFHPTGVPFIFFSGLSCLLLLSIFQDGIKHFKPMLLPFIIIFFTLLPYLIRLLMEPLLYHFMKITPSLYTDKIIKDTFSNLFMFGPTPFFTSDYLFAYLVVIYLIFTQSCSAVTFVMFSALMVVPIFLLFPPFATLFSQIFPPRIFSRLRDICIRPFFSICFLFLLSYYGVKYLRRLKENQKNSNVYWTGVVLLTGINTYCIINFFWVRQSWVSTDILCSMTLTGLTARSILVIMAIISAILFYYFNKKKSFNSMDSFAFDCRKKSHLLMVLFLPLAISTIYLLPNFREKARITPQVHHIHYGGYLLDENYIPKLLEYISTHEKPLSVTIIAKDRDESYLLSQYIPQFTLYGERIYTLPNDEINKRFSKEVIDRIYDDNVSTDNTMALINKYKINYIIAHNDQHKKFAKIKTNFKLVSQDNDIYLYKIGDNRL
jgi:hypothetical protein